MTRLSTPCIFLLLFFLLTACTSAQPVSTSPSPSAITTPAPFISATGNFQEYALPKAHSGLMRPIVDKQGRVWMGEMNNNYLTVFDPSTHQFQQITPPAAAHGIMGTVVAHDDTIWFAEQYANYIGHYNPKTQQFQTFPLPTLSIPDPSNKDKTLTLPSAPNDLALDAQGNVWFSEMNADSLGMLNPQNGQIKQYPLSEHHSIQTLNPYGITVDAQGVVWFTQASNNRLGRLDPRTGSMNFYTLPGPTVSLMEVTSDSHGMIWATTFNNGLLIKFDPSSQAFTTFAAPSARSNTGGLYGIVAARNGEIWVTVSAENVVARLDQTAKHFIYYHLPTDGGLPFGIAQAPDNSLWFTESGSNKIGQLRP